MQKRRWSTYCRRGGGGRGGGALGAEGGFVQGQVAVEAAVLGATELEGIARAGSVAVARLDRLGRCIVGAPAGAALYDGERILRDAAVVAFAEGGVGVERYTISPRSRVGTAYAQPEPEPVFWLEHPVRSKPIARGATATRAAAARSHERIMASRSSGLGSDSEATAVSHVRTTGVTRGANEVAVDESRPTRRRSSAPRARSR